MAVTAVISDFGGVLTTPLAGIWEKFEARSGVKVEQLGIALAAMAAARGDNPLFALETARLSADEFVAALSRQLGEQLKREVPLDGFGAAYFGDLEVNHAFVDYVRGLRERGLKLALCTNNVREWSGLWRAMLPVEEIFDAIVDSSQVGARKPDPAIYEATLDQLGVAAEDAVFVDDLQVNCDGARALGLHPVWFQETEQAIADIEAALAAP